MSTVLDAIRRLAELTTSRLLIEQEGPVLVPDDALALLALRRAARRECAGDDNGTLAGMAHCADAQREQANALAVDASRFLVEEFKYPTRQYEVARFHGHALFRAAQHAFEVCSRPDALQGVGFGCDDYDTSHYRRQEEAIVAHLDRCLDLAGELLQSRDDSLGFFGKFVLQTMCFDVVGGER